MADEKYDGAVEDTAVEDAVDRLEVFFGESEEETTHLVAVNAGLEKVSLAQEKEVAHLQQANATQKEEFDDLKQAEVDPTVDLEEENALPKEETGAAALSVTDNEPKISELRITRESVMEDLKVVERDWKRQKQLVTDLREENEALREENEALKEQRGLEAAEGQSTTVVSHSHSLFSSLASFDPHGQRTHKEEEAADSHSNSSGSASPTAPAMMSTAGPGSSSDT